MFMGHTYQIVVNLEVSQRSAKDLAEATRCWLVDRRILAGRPSPCLPPVAAEGAPRPGFAPGLQAEQILQSGLALTDPAAAVTLRGAEFITGPREVFTSGSLPLQLRCTACLAVFSPDLSNPAEPFLAAVGAWKSGEDQIKLACAGCAKETRLVAWEGPTPWAFGRVALKLWNLPPVKPGFVVELGAFWGHRPKLVTGAS